MTIEDDVREWAATRPLWQQEVLAELADGREFTDADLESLADRVAAATGTATAAGSSTLSIRHGTADQVQLVELGSLNCVNALIDGETLTFGGDGLTIIYGDNGSGKSGYARLLKNMIKTRHEEVVLANVFEDGGDTPSAELVYTISGSREVQKLGEPVPSALRQMTFYDVNCGEMYISTASSVSYRPSALSLLDGLINVCDGVATALRVRRDASEREALRLDIPEETTAGKFIAALSPRTTTGEIDAATELPPTVPGDLADVLAEEARLRGTDPTKEKARLSRLGRQIADLASHLDVMVTEFSSTRIKSRLDAKQKALNLRAAADLAAKGAFEDVPLQGVGSETWRVLWDAARQYSLSEAFHDHEFPVVDDGAVCVLCQQPLSTEAKSRLSQFEQFVRDTTAQDAGAAEAAYERMLDELRALVIQSTEHAGAITALTSVDADLASSTNVVLGGC